MVETKKPTTAVDKGKKPPPLPPKTTAKPPPPKGKEKDKPKTTAGKPPPPPPKGKVPDKTAGKKPAPTGKGNDKKPPAPSKGTDKKSSPTTDKKGKVAPPIKAPTSGKTQSVPELIKELKAAATAKPGGKDEGQSNIPFLLNGLHTAALAGKRSDVLKALDSITAVMKNHPNGADIQHRACGVLWALCCDQKDDATRKTVAKGGTAISLMLSALSLKEDLVIQHALGALGNVIVNNNDAKKSVGKSGATSAWKVVVEKGTGTAPSKSSGVAPDLIVEAGLGFLKSLSSQTADGKSKPDPKKVASPDKKMDTKATAPPILGATEMSKLVSILEKRASKPKIQMNGIGLLQNLAQSPAHQKQITAAGGAKVIKTAHTKDSSAAMSAICCGAIANLTVSGGDTATDYAGSIELIIKALQTNKKDELLQSEGCRALCGLALKNAKNQAAIGTKGGIKAIIAAMEAHSQKADVMHHGCAALVNICSNHSANKALIVNSGGVKVLATSLQKHVKDANIIREATGALANLSGDDSLRDKINKEKVSEVLKKTLKAHPKDKVISSHAELAIANLSGEAGVKGDTKKPGGKEVTKTTGKETLAKGDKAFKGVEKKATKAGKETLAKGDKAVKGVEKKATKAGKETLAKGDKAVKGVEKKATKAGKETLAKGDKAVKGVEKKATKAGKETLAKGAKVVTQAKKHKPVVIPKPVKLSR